MSDYSWRVCVHRGAACRMGVRPLVSGPQCQGPALMSHRELCTPPVKAPYKQCCRVLAVMWAWHGSPLCTAQARVLACRPSF